VFRFPPFPVGWGALKVAEERYLPSQEWAVTRVDRDGNYTVELYPFRYINASIFARKLSYNPATKSYVLPAAAAPSPISPEYETAFVILERVPDENLADFTTFVSVSSSTELVPIRLVPGEYTMDGFLFYESETNPIRIPAETVTFEVPFSEDEVIDFNESIYEEYSMGGIAFDETTGLVEITQEQLFNSDRVVFYVFRFPPPMTHSESLKNLPGLESMSKTGEMTMLYKEKVLPTWLGDEFQSTSSATEAVEMQTVTEAYYEE